MKRFAVLIGALVFAGCSTSSHAATSGPSNPSEDRIESVSAYAERVLPQTFDSPLQAQALQGDLAIGEVKVCISARARGSERVRASDFALVLPNGRHIVAGTGAITPKLPDGRQAPGSCAHGFINWNVPADQHPTIVDTQTGAAW